MADTVDGIKSLDIAEIEIQCEVDKPSEASFQNADGSVYVSCTKTTIVLQKCLPDYGHNPDDYNAGLRNRACYFIAKIIDLQTDQEGNHVFRIELGDSISGNKGNDAHGKEKSSLSDSKKDSEWFPGDCR